MKLLMSTSAVALICVALASPVHAQTSAETTAAGDEYSSPEPNKPTLSVGTPSVSDIVVTARRREENIQSVPVAVTALGADTLQDRTIQTTLDLTNNVPGLRVSGEGSQYSSTVSLRGLTRIANNPTSSAVMVYLNEVALPGVGLRLPTFDLASVQVLKGPQGTLFGRNSIGGAILATSVAPTYDYTGYVKGSFGNLDYRAIEGAVTLPIVPDVLSVRLAGQVRRRDGYMTEISTGLKAQNVHQDSFRISVLFEPTENIRSMTIYDWFQGDETNDAAILFGLNEGVVNAVDGTVFPLGYGDGLRAALAAQLARGPRKFNAGLPPAFVKTRQWGITNTTSIDLGGAVLKNVIGYRSNSTRNGPGRNDGAGPLIIDGRDQVTLLVFGNIADDIGFSEEIQLQGQAFNDRLDYTAGFYYYRTAPGGVRGTTFQAFSSSITNPMGLPPLANASYLYERSYSGFAQISFKLTDSLNLTAGGRYTDVTVDGCGQAVPYTTFDGYVTPKACSASGRTITTNDKKPTWTFGFDYRVNPELMFYGVTRRGFREGAVNSPRFNTPATEAILGPYQTYGPETLTDIEIGFKSNYSFGNVRTVLNVAAFRSIYDNVVQFLNVGSLINSNDPGYPNQGAFGFNGGKERITGVEFDGMISPIPELRFMFNGAYIDQKVLRTSAPSTLPSVAVPPINLATPKFSYTLAAQLVLPYRPLDGELVLNVDRYETQKFQVQGYFFPGYSVSNARIDWNDIGGKGISVGFFMRNVFDKAYIVAPNVVLPTFPVRTGLYTEPRNYGLEARFAF